MAGGALKYSAALDLVASHVLALEHLDKVGSGNKTAVVFSGPQAAGKSTLSRLLAAKAEGLVVSTDRVRQVLAAHGYKVNFYNVTVYLRALVFVLGKRSQNPLWIFDASLDRAPLAVWWLWWQGFDVKVIRLVGDVAVWRQRLAERDDAEEVLANYDKYLWYYRAFAFWRWCLGIPITVVVPTTGVAVGV